MADRTPAEPMRHLARPTPPWRAPDRTECGRQLVEDQALTRDQLRAVLEQHSREYAEARVCASCWSTAARWPDWDADPVLVVARETHGPKTREGMAAVCTPSWRAELRAIAALVEAHPERLSAPLRWRRPRRIFVDSLTDLFHDAVPWEFIARVWAVMAACPQHEFVVLTKRHARMRSVLTDRCGPTNPGRPGCRSGHQDGVHLRSAMEWAATPHNPDHVPGLLPGLYHRTSWPLPNVVVGVSVEDQRTADLRIPALLETPAAVRAVSCEPLLGPVDLAGPVDEHGGRPHQTYWLTGQPGWGPEYPEPTSPRGLLVQDLVVGPRLDWVIAGGESGPGSRSAHPDWFRQLRDQCATSGVPYLLKQHGDWTWSVGPDVDREPDLYVAPDGRVADEAGATADGGSWKGVWRVGKGRAGRELDGLVHDEHPARVAAAT